MKFNRKETPTKTVNLAGGKAFKESPKLEFVTLLLTSFVKDKFYESENEQLTRLRGLINSIQDKKFIAKAAIFARTKYGMRSISHVTAGEIACAVKGESWTKNFFDKIVYRPDDMTEILAYYGNFYGKPFPNSLKKGFAKALLRFNDYELSKYRKEGAAVSLVDIVNLVHPRGNATLKKLIAGELKSTQTWEAKLSAAGQEAENEEEKTELKEKAWKDLILEKKIGYFALLRNLRNIIEQAPEVLDEALELLVDKKLIKNSLVLPFRFDTARTEIEKLSGKPARATIQALSKAVDIACSNVPKFKGETCVVLDESGSMSGQPEQIGSLFSAILVKSNNADMVVFAQDAGYVSVNPDDSILTITEQIKGKVSGGTNFNAIFERLERKYDRIIILSDMQGWMEAADDFTNMGGTPTRTFAAYKNKFNANPIVYSFDLNGYGTLQFPEPNVYCMAGFSDKVFDTMKLLEEDKDALIHEIEKIEL